ncbi:SAM-dependent methyltransferase [Streptomyces bathyalis]|uniref:S-adenosyl-L-methionine-dependent methyltransferase n=1 Tax=Streptomyces bathyalis TaxID=2710756 RepID=A0A7T1T488_9ACTN|nr:SAM-dependent methyltransferase [Streptomyces bathyalis]QPP06126.1 SAM-dependent methyltransferase [Streptomyces bathyalis]
MSTDQQWDIVTGVGLTALAVAAGRAAESERPDALINDPYASRLVAAARPSAPVSFSDGKLLADGTDDELWSGTSDYVGLRSRVFDDYFLRASADGIRQVVILASGLDTRAYRLPWPSGTVCFELDQPAVLGFKSATLDEEGAAPGCDHRPVPVDLRDDWGAALETRGFDRSRPTAWLAEGLLPYLPPEAEVRLFEEVSRLSAADSRFALERIDNMHHLLNDPLVRERADSVGFDLLALLPGGEREPVEKQLTRLGWQFEDHPVAESAAAFQRPQTGPSMFREHVTHTIARRA